MGYAEDITLDSAGRMLVSAALREFANLEKEVMLVGQGSHFEMWNMEAWRKQLENVMSGDGIEMPAELRRFFTMMMGATSAPAAASVSLSQTMSRSFSHTTVLLDEAVDALNIKPSGTYIDGTFGRGGHSKKILSKLVQRRSLICHGSEIWRLWKRASKFKMRDFVSNIVIFQK